MNTDKGSKTDTHANKAGNANSKEKSFSNTSGSKHTDDGRTIPVIEEKIITGKEVVETGGYRINKTVQNENAVVEVPLKHESVDIERIPINKYVDTAPPAVRHEGNTMIVPVLKEVVVKRLVLVEELHITRHTHQEQGKIEVNLRKEKVDIDRIPGNKT